MMLTILEGGLEDARVTMPHGEDEDPAPLVDRLVETSHQEGVPTEPSVVLPTQEGEDYLSPLHIVQSMTETAREPGDVVTRHPLSTVEGIPTGVKGAALGPDLASDVYDVGPSGGTGREYVLANNETGHEAGPGVTRLPPPQLRRGISSLLGQTLEDLGMEMITWIPG